jgi:hypothetical protein
LQKEKEKKIVFRPVPFGCHIQGDQVGQYFAIRLFYSGISLNLVNMYFDKEMYAPFLLKKLCL